MEFSVQAVLSYRVQQETILPRLPADHCAQEISDFPAMQSISALELWHRAIPTAQ